ncbi:MAG: flavodoxin family protein [Candidatus Hodarchaeales archaeon]|jgi:multimeric flavodoxin WrbA
MKKILGVVGSYRKQGNTELFTKLALRDAEKYGITTEMIRLTDFTFKPCKGCMACVFKAARCRIDDDFYPFLELLEQADGVLMGTPTYILGPQAQYKQILDRALVIPQHLNNLQGKPACTVTVSGLKGWQALSPMLNLVVLGFGMNLLESVNIYGPGPGQALLEDNSQEKAQKIGKKLALAVKGEDYSTIIAETSEKVCPICYGQLFTPVKKDQLECALCKTKATIADNPDDAKDFKLQFEKESLTNHRWTEAGMVHHMEEWVKTTEHMYFDRLEEIAQFKNTLKSYDRWVSAKDRINQ